jgi:hypothetical protein
MNEEEGCLSRVVIFAGLSVRLSVCLSFRLSVLRWMPPLRPIRTRNGLRRTVDSTAKIFEFALIVNTLTTTTTTTTSSSPLTATLSQKTHCQSTSSVFHLANRE